MGINIVTSSRDREYQNIIGIMEEEDIDAICNVSFVESIKCLIFIDPYDDTIFNKKQVAQIKKEIDLLRKDSKINFKVLDDIEKAISYVLEEKSYYVEFIGD